MINTFLVGISGSMGKAVIEAASDSDDIVICGGLDKTPCNIGIPTFENASKVDLPAIDIIIDFSRPATLPEVIALSDRYSAAVVIATTGYSKNELENINELSKRRAVLLSSNMSLGVNLLTVIAENTAKALGSAFDIEIVEKHHNKKADSPSGTAIMLAEAAVKGRNETIRLVYGRQGANSKRVSGEIGISSVRGGTIVGEHELMFIGNDEIVTLSHTALSKKIFAVGALKAARFLVGKPCGLFDMKSVLFDKK